MDYHNLQIDVLIEIIPNCLEFAVLKSPWPNRRVKTDGNKFYFSIDEELLYQNYYLDFGPLNISCLYKYCMKLIKYLQYGRGIKRIVHYTCSNPDKKANATFLIGPVGPLKPYLDASQVIGQFNLKMLDCYEAIMKAHLFNFFNFQDFNVSEYDLYNKLEYGDVNWLVPRKFLAFIGPTDNHTSHSPEFYIKYFLKHDVKTVIRLNNVLYDSYAFMQVGIQHYDLIFPDGTTPPREVLLKFLYVAETAPAAIAVHCKAGLGRTGSLIGAYLIKHYRMSAREAIAWMRVCRPGSVIGHQQLWLEKIQSWLWRIGSQYRLEHYGEGDKIPRHKYGIYSKLWPIEREKLMKKVQIISQAAVPSNHNKMMNNSTSSYKNISKLLESVYDGPTTAHCQNQQKEVQKKSSKNKGNSKLSGTSQGDRLNEIKRIRTQKLKTPTKNKSKRS